MKHIELFAGIGGFRLAMQQIEKDYLLPFQCVGFSEIDKNAKKTYCANFETTNEVDMGDIVSFNKNPTNIEGLDFDLITGGFPCQSFSMMGNQNGFDDDRGTLFFQIEKILQIKKKQIRLPRFIILENVKNLITHDKGNTIKIITNKLRTLGYTVFYDIFNTFDFGLAQKRNRVIIFATLIKPNSDFEFLSKKISESFKRNVDNSSVLLQNNILDVLEKTVEKKYYLSEKIKPTILANGSKLFVSNSEINQLIARPLTASMHKMHRACQDNYYSDDFINASEPEKYLEKKFSKEELSKQAIRKLTPNEAFALQGFDESFVKNARLANVSDCALFKQAGNAVSVNVIYAVLRYIFVENRFYNQNFE